MNPRLVIRHVGALLGLLGIAMTSAIPFALYFEDMPGLVAMALSAAMTFATGAGMYLGTRKERGNIARRDAFAIVTAAWLSFGVFGALPYLLGGTLSSPVDAFFESVSGFTTTGSSVIPRPSTVHKSILYWRSLTQWLGGMGIIVLFVAVFAELGVGGRFLFKSEVPGPIKDSVRPKIRDTSSALWKIYLLFTAAETAALVLSGMDFFDALCHSFTTMSTGGFSTRDASIAEFGPGATLVIIVFMVVAGANFSLYFQAFAGRPGVLRRDRELRAYLGVLGLSALLVTISILERHDSAARSLLHGTFQVVSIATTTGYVTDDFNAYPPMAAMILVSLMFVGGCAGSTAGGIKVVRFLIVAKLIQRSLFRMLRPHVVMPVRVGGHVIPDSNVEETAGFFALYLFVFVVATLFVAAHGLDMVTSFTSVAATLGNIGPGLGRVGAVQNYGHLPATVKFVLSLCMIMGRLELYTVLSLTVSAFWRR